MLAPQPECCRQCIIGVAPRSHGECARIASDDTHERPIPLFGRRPGRVALRSNSASRDFAVAVGRAVCQCGGAIHGAIICHRPFRSARYELRVATLRLPLVRPLYARCIVSSLPHRGVSALGGVLSRQGAVLLPRLVLLALGFLVPLNLPFSIPQVEEEKLFGWSSRAPLDSSDDELVVTRTTRVTRSAGLLPGDALLRANGAPASPASLSQLRSEARAGDTLQLVIRRGEEVLTVRIPVVESPASSTGYYWYLVAVAWISWVVGMSVLAWRGSNATGLTMGAALLLLPPIIFSSGVPGDATLLGLARTAWHLQAAAQRIFFPALLFHFCVLQLRTAGFLRAPWFWGGVYLIGFAGLATVTSFVQSPLIWTQYGWQRDLRTGLGLLFELPALATALYLYLRRRDLSPTLRWAAFAIGLFAATAAFRSTLLLAFGGEADLDIIRRVNGLTVILLPVTAGLYFFGSSVEQGSEWQHRRRAAFSASVLLTVLYGVGVTGSAAVVLTATRQNLGGAEWILFAAVFFAAIVFSPVLRWAREMVDRRMLVHWNQLEQLAHNVAGRISAELELDRIGERVSSDLPSLVKASSARLVLVEESVDREGTAPEISLLPRSDLIQELASHGTSMVPVYRGDGELVGGIQLGVPSVNHHFDAPEQAVLRILSHAVGAALRNAESYSQLRRVQHELAEVERVASMGAMAGGLAHEIKNPLAGLKMGLYLLEREGVALERIQRLNRDVRRIDDLVSGLLRFTHEGSSEAPEPLDLRAVTQSCVGDMRPLAEDRGVVLIERYPERPTIIRGSEQQMRLVISNLLSNALDAVAYGDIVEVSLADAGTVVELTVRDSGPGITQQVRDHMFEFNFSTKPRGTGLGLALARRETERLGGRIEVVAGDRHGTTLRVALPRII